MTRGVTGVGAEGAREGMLWGALGRHARWLGGGGGVGRGMVLLMLLLPGILGVRPDALSESQFAGPSWAHWLGRDANGRDLLARVCDGARVSLVVGLAGSLVSLVIGVSWGMVSGYLGGRWDGVMMRVVDILYSMPSILFVIVLVTVLQEPVEGFLESVGGRRGGEMASILFLVVGLGGVSWLTMARIVRGQVLSLRQRPFMEAARALGAGHARSGPAASSPAEHDGGDSGVSDADDPRDCAGGILSEFSGAGDPAAAGEFGIAVGGRCGADQSGADGVDAPGGARGSPGRAAAGAQLPGGRIAGRLGSAEPGLMDGWVAAGGVGGVGG